jgi:hypothetical protein
MSVLYGETINYEQKAASGSYYNLQRYLQNTGGSTVTLAPNSNYTSIFDLPADVYNLSRSYLKFDLTILHAATLATGLRIDIPPIRSFTLGTKSGKVACRITNLQHYWKMVSLLGHKREDFAKRPVAGTGTYLNALPAYTYPPAQPTDQVAANTAQDRGICYFNNPSQTLKDQAPVDANGSHAALIVDTGNVPVVENKMPGVPDYVIPQLYVTGAVANTVAGDINVKCELHFSDLFFTFFSVDRDFYCTEALQLWVEWEIGNNFAFTHSLAADLTTPVPSTNVPTLTALELIMAMEANEGVRQSVMNKVRTTGLQMLIPDMTVYIQSLGTNTANALNFRMNRQYGERILRIITCENIMDMANGDSLTARCIFANTYHNRTVLLYNTQMDSRRIQLLDINTVADEDYRQNEKYLKNSVLNNKGLYRAIAPLHIENYSADPDLTNCRETDLVQSGLPLLGDMLYTKYYMSKSARDIQVVLLLVTQKTLRSLPEGIFV